MRWRACASALPVGMRSKRHTCNSRAGKAWLRSWRENAFGEKGSDIMACPNSKTWCARAPVATPRACEECRALVSIALADVDRPPSRRLFATSRAARHGCGGNARAWPGNPLAAGRSPAARDPGLHRLGRRAGSGRVLLPRFLPLIDVVPGRARVGRPNTAVSRRGRFIPIST